MKKINNKKKNFVILIASFKVSTEIYDKPGNSVSPVACS